MSKYRFYLLGQGFTFDQLMPMTHGTVRELIELDFYLDDSLDAR